MFEIISGLLGLSLLWTSREVLAVSTWTGNGANTNWFTNGNWTPVTPSGNVDSSSSSVAFNFPTSKMPTVNTNVTAHEVDINQAGWTFSGSPTNYIFTYQIFSGGSGTNVINAGVDARPVQPADFYTDSGNTLVINGNVRDRDPVGYLVKNGPGTLVLNYPNTFTGNTQLQDGTIRLGDKEALGPTIGNVGGTLDLNGRDVQGDVVLDVALNGHGVGGGGSLINGDVLHGATLDGDVELTADSSVGGVGNLVLKGQITGNHSLMKVGVGTITLLDNNTYVGGTTVTAGTLVINNTSGSGTGPGNVSVTGGTLGGTGTISGDVAISGGTLSPGNSPGVLTLGGSLSLVAGTYKYEVDSTPTATADLVNVAGNLNIGSGTVTFSASDLGSSLLAMGTKFSLFDYGGTWNGGVFNGPPNFPPVS